VPSDRLAQANALDQLVRPLVFRMAGPALGGLLVASGGAGLVFALDSASFVFSAAVMWRVRVRAGPGAERARSVVMDLGEGWRFVRRRAWLWATFASAAVAYLCFMGPVEVLLPYLVKNDIHGSARDLGMVFAAGGIGSVTCAIAMGQSDIPRRAITFIYACWTLATLAVAGYGLSSSLWLISIGLLPLSFALTGPVAAAIGTRGTLVAAGVVGAAVTAAAFFVPGMRAVEARPGPVRADASLRDGTGVLADAG
jgi:Transmembrane secretion effector